MVSAHVWRPSVAAASSAPAAPRVVSDFQRKVSLATIKNRRDFLAVTSGHRIATSAFVLQMRRRPVDHPVKDIARVGFTVTKKMGNAVARNRIKRRLREAVRKYQAMMAEGYDYVIIARQKSLDCPFEILLGELQFAFSKIPGKKGTA